MQLAFGRWLEWRQDQDVVRRACAALIFCARLMLTVNETVKRGLKRDLKRDLKRGLKEA